MLPIDRLAQQAGSSGRVDALNLENTPDKDGIVRGSILPVGMKQSSLNYIVAVVTLSLFVSWPYVVALLFLSSAILMSGLVPNTSHTIIFKHSMISFPVNADKKTAWIEWG